MCVGCAQLFSKKPVSRPKLVRVVKMFKAEDVSWKSFLLETLSSKKKVSIHTGTGQRCFHWSFRERYALFDDGVALKELLLLDNTTGRLGINNSCIGDVRKTVSGRRGKFTIVDLVYDLDHGYLEMMEKD